MNKSLVILMVSLMACGVDAHDPSPATDRLQQLLRDDCSYCDGHPSADNQTQIRQQREILRKLRHIEFQQRWDKMQDFADRQNKR